MKKSLLVIVLLGLSASAAAGEAHFCGSPEVGAIETGRHDVNDSTVFTCGGGIKGTLPELAKQGWKVVQVSDQMASSSSSDPSKSTVYSRLIIQKD
ncbi:hypothetical protein [Citrobacter werkmanii]|uniref:hypothetical protein n=1 Tax=Citrobacter werkmanii TaxID=67827 RepID=UPI000506D625|nr:hypothetical protein [Citrobacter werkmanii]GAS72793.1 hypothetical protein NGUA40_02409 [Salmonella enterica]UCA23069.1 hypothetical protein LA356_11860 [Citrobacter werkmanii]GAL44405.1 hypothetical protein CIWKM_07_02475 [Citrobacter werkmanii NBRC 105721]GAS75949.1 hypothetical protein NGUA41_00798 [Salmonella enterica]HCR3450715.1 hypothetical protein [Citrobacter werkmanii]